MLLLSGANLISYESGVNWYISAKAHSLFSHMMKPSGQVYYTWDDVKETNQNLATFGLYVLIPDFIKPMFPC